jgi:hypothetical protein
VRILFRDFWPGFNPNSNFFFELLRAEDDIQVVEEIDHADLEIYSVFTNNFRGKRGFSRAINLLERGLGLVNQSDAISRNTYGYRTLAPKDNVKRVWFTGEKRFPPTDLFDLTLGFEVSSLPDRNIYFPLWMYRLDWGFGKTWNEIAPTPYELTLSREVQDRAPSLVAFSSNQDPFRVAMLNRMETKMPVVKFGLGFSNPVSSKLNASKDFLFQLCPENDVYPGYITEKLIEAWVCECVPIWRGGMTDSRFNPQAFIDVTGLSITDAVEKVMGYSKSELNEMRQQPLLNAPPSLREIQEAFRDLFS